MACLLLDLNVKERKDLCFAGSHAQKGKGILLTRITFKKEKKNIDRKKKRKLLKEQKETKSFFLDLYPKNGELCPFAIIINYIDPLCAKAILLY